MGRTQVVSVRNATSSKAEVLSGVPQGSVLGPLLFILYINDLPNHVNSSIQMFADDTKIFTKVDKPEDTTKLQHNIDELQKWSRKWLLRFNATKCKTMHIGSKNPEVKYTMDGVVLEAIDQEKDLGVYIPNNCKPSAQCSKADQKAMNSLRVIRRTFKFIDKGSFAVLYKTYIRPHLEYCVQAWNPCMQKDIITLELARYNWPHSFSCAARCCKPQISCHNKRYIYSCHNRDPIPAKFKHVMNIETCTLLCCDHSTLWKALDANMVEIGARCSDKNVKILGRYQWIG